MRTAWLPLLLAALLLPHAGAQSPAPAPAKPPPEPPAPAASAPVQKLLDESARLLHAKKPQEALAAADSALAAAKEAKDAAGEALAQGERGMVLQELDRSGDALVAWKEAAAAWQRASDG